MFRHKRSKMTVWVILALVLTVALAPAAAAQVPPPEPPTDPTPDQTTPGPPGGGGDPPDPPGSPTPTGTGTPAPPNGSPTPSVTPSATPGSGGGMTAPAWPPAGLLVTHAATQVQLAPSGGGLHVYLIGSDGTGHPGPWIDSFANLAQTHAGTATLWTGTNPGTGKSVTIHYLAAEKKIRISTYYPDTQYDTNKPYVFTVDSGHKVVHEQW